MVVAGSSIAPEMDEFRLLASGRIRVSFEGDRTEVWKRPTVGELKFALERYSEIVMEESEKDVKGTRLDVGPRWFTEMMAVLGPEFAALPTKEERLQAAGAVGGRYDSDNAPSWATRAEVFTACNQHWMEVPLVSDVVVPEPEVPVTPTAPISMPTEPVLLTQAPAFGGP